MRLSFIVPIYNVASYLRKCVDSLLNQDFDNYEIILIDDGSTDGSGRVADKIKESNSQRVRVVHQMNKGLSEARNTGIEAAKGEYVCFVDSDDYWEENVLGKLMERVDSEDLDVLRFKYQHVNEQYDVYCPYKTNPYQYDNYSSEVVTGEEFLAYRMGTACYACTFIVKRILLKGCMFTPNIYFEDTDWTPRMLLTAKRVASTDTIVYNYLIRKGSITHAVEMSKKRKILCDQLRLIQMLSVSQNTYPHLQWFGAMIAATTISVIGSVATLSYNERDEYLGALNDLNIFPLSLYMANKTARCKIVLSNISPRLMVYLLLLCNLLRKQST